MDGLAVAVECVVGVTGWHHAHRQLEGVDVEPQLRSDQGGRLVVRRRFPGDSFRGTR